MPLRRDGAGPDLPAGYDGALVGSVTGREQGVEPDTLIVIAAAVRSDRSGQGLAG